MELSELLPGEYFTIPNNGHVFQYKGPERACWHSIKDQIPVFQARVRTPWGIFVSWPYGWYRKVTPQSKPVKSSNTNTMNQPKRLNTERDRKSSTIVTIRMSEHEMAMLEKVVETTKKGLQPWQQRSYGRSTAIIKLISMAHNEIMAAEVKAHEATKKQAAKKAPAKKSVTPKRKR